jgi:hypothetical protein
MTDQPNHETWAVVEVMGHSRYAGRVSQHTALGGAMIRVEVPAIDGIPAFEKLLSPQAIFAITPCTEALAVECAKRFRSRPFTLLDLPELCRAPKRPLLEHEDDDPDDDLPL